MDFQNKVAQILDLETKETRQEKYDFFIAGTGLRRVFPTVPQSLKREEFLKEVLSHKEAIRSADDGVVVIGGGNLCLCHLSEELWLTVGTLRRCWR